MASNGWKIAWKNSDVAENKFRWHLKKSAELRIHVMDKITRKG
jgi:hypothetical protein